MQSPFARTARQVQASMRAGTIQRTLVFPVWEECNSAAVSSDFVTQYKPYTTAATDRYLHQPWHYRRLYRRDNNHSNQPFLGPSSLNGRFARLRRAFEFDP